MEVRCKLCPSVSAMGRRRSLDTERALISTQRTGGRFCGLAGRDFAAVAFAFAANSLALPFGLSQVQELKTLTELCGIYSFDVPIMSS